jgi:integrase
MNNYSNPKIYDAGGDLSKRWYIYYSFRNPATKKLVRQTPIYGGINKLKTLSERKTAAKNLCWAVQRHLENGFNPYSVSKFDSIDVNYTIKEAFDYALRKKNTVLSENSYSDFRIRITKFKKWLIENGIDELQSIDTITKKVVTIYLNEIAEETSARNRNNTRSNLSMLFKVLEDDEIIKDNFVNDIAVLKSTPERNKSYTSTQEKNIETIIESEPILSVFIKLISYNFLRPIEVCRLKVSDIDIVDKKIYIRAKNQPVKTKIIPDIMIKELPELTHLDPNSFFITPYGFGMEWNATETNRRNAISDLFRVRFKTPLNLGKEYGLYSFRHTYITKLYNELVKNATPFEAKSKLMLITGHTTMTALDKYLRDIDAVLPDDYSNLIKK